MLKGKRFIVDVQDLETRQTKGVNFIIEDLGTRNCNLEPDKLIEMFITRCFIALNKEFKKDEDQTNGIC